MRPPVAEPDPIPDTTPERNILPQVSRSSFIFFTASSGVYALVSISPVVGLTASISTIGLNLPVNLPVLGSRLLQHLRLSAKLGDDLRGAERIMLDGGILKRPLDGGVAVQRLEEGRFLFRLLQLGGIALLDLLLLHEELLFLAAQLALDHFQVRLQGLPLLLGETLARQQILVLLLGLLQRVLQLPAIRRNDVVDLFLGEYLAGHHPRRHPYHLRQH